MNYAWTTSENAVLREHEIAKAKISEDAAGDSALAIAGGTFLSGLVKNVIFPG